MFSYYSSFHVLFINYDSFGRFVSGSGQVNHRDIFHQISTNQTLLHNYSNTAGNWSTGISSNYRTYDPSSSKYASVAATRASAFDPQKGFANFYGTGRYSSSAHWFANSSQVSNANTNRISYLAPSGSQPNAYYWAQDFRYANPTKAVFANQQANGLNFYRLSDGNKVVMDQFANTSPHWFYYNRADLDNNLFTISSASAVSKIESTSTDNQDNTNTPVTPLLFQTHGGIPADTTATWRTDYSRDSWMQTDDRESYVIYHPNFGSNVQIPTNVETLGEWRSNDGYDYSRSGSNTLECF